MVPKFLIGLLLVVSLQCSVFADPGSLLTEYFDEYGKISWSKEQLHLLNLERHLRDNPTMIGYIGFHWRNKAEYIKMKKRAIRAKTFLLRRKRIKASRIRIIAGSQRDEARTILQPVLKNLPPPKFSL